jgi:hypothetical protein
MRLLVCLLCLSLPACVTVRQLQVELIDATSDDTIAVTSPVKVHRHRTFFLAATGYYIDGCARTG